QRQLKLPVTPVNEEALVAQNVPFYPAIYYLEVWRHLAHRRGESGKDPGFAAELKKFGVDNWREADLVTPAVRVDWRRRVRRPGPLLALFAYKIMPETVRKAAEAAPASFERRIRLCEADFYIGEYQLAEGHAEWAKTLFQSAIDNCPAGVPEAIFAKAEM